MTIFLLALVSGVLLAAALAIEVLSECGC